MNTRKTRGLVLALVLSIGLLGASLAASAAGSVTLYTGGGTIISSAWSQTAGRSGVYQGSGNLPSPTMLGATFEGWYTDAALTTGKVSSGTTAGVGPYYAKWTLDGVVATNQKMGFSYTNMGGTTWGFKNGTRLSAFFANMGFIVGYSTSVPASGDITANYIGTTFKDFEIADTTKDIFVATQVPDVYVARLMTLEGGLTRLSLLVQNRGTSTVTGFNIGAAGDAQLGNNDFVPLRQGSDQYGSYLAMQDTAVDNELRLYTSGESVTPVDRLWWGGYQPTNNTNVQSFLANTFNDGKDSKYADGIDSAFAFSWKDIAVKSGETKTYSVLLGVGAVSEGFVPGSTVTYDANGGTDTPTDDTRYAYGSIATIVAGTPKRTEFTFDGWSTTRGNITDPLQAGDRFPLSGDTTLYAIWKPVPHGVSLSVREAGVFLEGLNVTLYTKGVSNISGKLDENSPGRYTSDSIPLYPNGYNIYINDKFSSFSLSIPPSGTAEMTLDYGAVDIYLTKDGQPILGGQVTLQQTGIVHYVLPLKDGKYTTGLVKVGDYDIVINGQNYGSLTASATERTIKRFGTITYQASLTKDGGAWGDASVTLMDADGKAYATTLAEGMYQATLPSGDYKLMLDRTQDTGFTLTAENPKKTLAFYTVTYRNGSKDYSTDTPQRTRFVQENTWATAPPVPDSPDGKTTFAGWKTTDGGDTNFDFSAPITQPTKIYASWNTPTVATGGYTRLTDTTYRLTQPKITGYEDGYQITSVQVVVNSGTIALHNWTATGNQVMGDRTATLTVIFATPQSIAATEALLKDNLVFTADGKAMHRVDITVRASRIGG